MKLQGRRVLVTGGSRGIGEAIARACTTAGADVALVARSRDQLEKVAADIGGRGYVADLADPSQVDGLIGRVEADGPIDVLVNNAGIDEAGSFLDMADGRIAHLLHVNLVAPMELCRQVIPGMVTRGGGHVVNVSSMAGTNGVPGLAAYSASKAGLSHFTALLRAEFKGQPVATTLVEIAVIETEMADHARTYGPTARAWRRLERLQLLPETRPERIAAAVVSAVEHGRRHVRLPRRDAMFPLIVEAPRRMSEWLLAGVDAQAK
jgi:short-subunit dehydrogenase